MGHGVAARSPFASKTVVLVTAFKLDREGIVLSGHRAVPHPCSWSGAHSFEWKGCFSSQPRREGSV